MAEHIVSLSFSIDDDRIAAILEKNAYKDILKKIDEDMIGQLPNKYHSYTRSGKEIDWREVAGKVVAEFIEEHRDEVIEAAAKEVAASIKRSKKYKDALSRAALEIEG